MLQLKKIKGGALLTALFIMTLIAIVATAMTVRLQQEIYRAHLLLNHDKMHRASDLLTFWAMNQLMDKNNPLAQVNSLGMVAQFPRSMERIVPQIVITGGLYDLQSRFNLNNLIEKKALLGFIFLLSEVAPETPQIEKMNFSLALKHWLSPYDLAQGRDAYTTYYVSQQPPYYPSHQLMQNPSELRLIKNVSPNIFLALEPFITTLPESTPININTAPKQVLMTLGNGPKLASMTDLIIARGDSGVKNLKEISELLKKLDISQEQITIKSDYFMSVAKIQVNDAKLLVTTLLKRKKDQQGKITVRVLNQHTES